MGEKNCFSDQLASYSLAKMKTRQVGLLLYKEQEEKVLS